MKAALLDQDETEAHEQLEVWLKAWIAMYPTSRSPQDQGKPIRDIIHGGNSTLDKVALEAVMAVSWQIPCDRWVYASGWKQWMLFKCGSKRHLFLDGEGRGATAEDEQRLMLFVVFLHQVMGRSIGGIRQRLSAIRYAHVSSGFPDPLVGRPRLRAAVAGLQRCCANSQ